MLCLFLCKQITKNTNKSCNWRDYQRNLGPSGFPVCLALDMNICLLSQPQTFTSTQAQMIHPDLLSFHKEWTERARMRAQRRRREEEGGESVLADIRHNVTSETDFHEMK